jgi:spore germination protein KC
MYTSFFQKAFKVMSVLSLFISTLFLSGCWDRKEINDVAIVVGTGLDKPEDTEEGAQVELSIQYIVPGAVSGGGMGGNSGGTRGGKPIEVKSQTGESLFDAMSKLQEKMPRRIFWGHNKAIILSEDFAKEGIREQIDFFSRHPDPRLRSYVFVTEGKAKDILNLQLPLEQYSAEELRELSKFEISISVTVKDLLQMLKSEARATALPWIEKVTEDVSQTEKLRLNGTAVFKNGKMIGRIDDKTTRGVLWIRNEIYSAAVTVSPEETEGVISLNLLRSNTVLVPKIESGKWKISIIIDVEDDIVQNGTKLNTMNPEVIKKLEKLLEKDLKDRVNLALEQVQKDMRADIFGFSEAFHHKYPKQWNKVKDHWDEVFPEIEVTIISRPKIRRPGNSTVPQGLPEDEVKEK